MNGKRFLAKMIGIMLVAVLALSAWSMVAAQSNPPSSQTPFLGITTAPATDGVRVVQVVPDSPADKAGIKAGDVITLFDGKPAAIDTLSSAVQSHKVGDSVTVTVLRDGKTTDLTVVLAERPANLPTPSSPPTLAQRPYLGLTLNDSDKGVVIQQVAPQSPAADAGLVVGDIITAINGTKISQASDAVQAISALKPGDKVTLDILHDGNAKSVDVTLGSAPIRPGQGNFAQRSGIGLSYDGKQWTITQLSQDSDLYKAGLRSGDVLQSINGDAFDPAALAKLLTTADASTTVKVTVLRDGKSQDFDVPVPALRVLAMGAFMQMRPGAFMPPFMNGGGIRLGVTYVPLDDQTAKSHNLTVTTGALITDVAPDSPAATAGLKPNDVVTAVNGKAVDAQNTLTSLLSAYKPGDKVTLDVLRGSDKLQIDVTLGQAQFGNGFPNMPMGPFGNPVVPIPETPTAPQTNPAA